MFCKGFTLVSLIAVLTLVVLTGCTMHGGGIVSLSKVGTGKGIGAPTEATIAVSLNCNDKDMVRSNINLVDNTNGVHINAHLKWTPVSEFNVNSCEDAAAIMEQEGYSLAGGIISSQGQENGVVEVAVGAPGAVSAECGDLQPIYIEAHEDTPDALPGGDYFAYGCLDRGKINFR